MAHLKAKRYVFFNGEPRNDASLLENHRLMRTFFPIRFDCKLTDTWMFESRQYSQQRCLPAATRSDKANKFTIRYRQIDVIECRNTALFFIERFRQIT